MQGGVISDHFGKAWKPNSAQISGADELLVRAMLRHNIPHWFLTCEEFKCYIQVVSRGAYRSPSRYIFLQHIADLSERATAEITRRLEDQLFVSMEEDAWTRHNKHYHAITSGGQGESLFIGCFDIEKGGESAENQAMALHKSALAALNLNPCLNLDDDAIPEGKVAAITTDTTNVMPATVRHLGANYKLFLNCFWVPCFAHNMALFMADQVKIDKIKDTLRRAKSVAMAFKVGSLNKLLAMCVPTAPPGFCHMLVYIEFEDLKVLRSKKCTELQVVYMSCLMLA
jgi:hypothetical protein